MDPRLHSQAQKQSFTNQYFKVIDDLMQFLRVRHTVLNVNFATNNHGNTFRLFHPGTGSPVVYK